MPQRISFLLGDEARSLVVTDPALTVLDYLRLHETRSGTKEGCAEGDCGACTVVLGTPDPAGAGMAYRAVNSCIMFAGALDGQQLLSVEDLRSRDGALHPVQQAMVDLHGSQCGFCTPGFVMSLFALYHATAGADRAGVNAALAGNLCRCTGYRPIMDAALASCAGQAEDRFAANARETASRLRALVPAPDAQPADGGYCAPRSLDALAALYAARPDAVLVAGGTDVGLWVTKQHRALPMVIALDRVAGLADIMRRDGVLQIGAAASYEAALPALAEISPDIADLLVRLGSRQIRNLGTLGGNIANASPIGDTPPLLLALDAALVLRQGAATRRVALAEFFVGYRKTVLAPGEFISRIDIPLPDAHDQITVYKISKRFDQDISAVCGAFRLRLQAGQVADLRVAFGGMAATPLRVAAVEQALIGQAWSEPNIQAAMALLAQNLAPLSDFRASAAYRMQVARNLLYKFYLETAPDAPPAQTRLRPAIAAEQEALA